MSDPCHDIKSRNRYGVTTIMYASKLNRVLLSVSISNLLSYVIFAIQSTVGIKIIEHRLWNICRYKGYVYLELGNAELYCRLSILFICNVPYILCF